MRPTSFSLVLVTSLLAAGSTGASPGEASCLFLKVLGSNDAASVASMIDEVAPTWPEANRDDASEALVKVLNELEFVGGSAWQTAKLGQDIEEHLVLLRLSKGEVSGARLLYQWSPDGLTLTAMDFQRHYNEMISTQVLQAPKAIECAEGS